MSCDYVFKFITLGDSGVGKSCLTDRFTDRTYEDGGHVPTIGAGFGHRMITIDRKKIKLHIWDTAGQEKFRSLTQSFYRRSTAALLVYDITSRRSFIHVPAWLEDLRRQIPDETAVMLVGNKSDMGCRRAVSTEEGRRFAQDHGLLFMECSAKTAENVDDAFFVTAVAVRDRIRQIESDEEELRRRGIKSFGPRGYSSSSIYDTISMTSGGSSCCR